MKKISFNIIANAVIGYEGLSGGDSIFINFAKQIARKKDVEVNIFTWKHGELMCEKNGLDKSQIKFFLSGAGKFENLPFAFLYLVRTYLGIKKVWQVIKSGYFEDKKVIIYSASDFYPDSFVGLFFKSWLKKAKWVAGFYLFAPNPFKGFRGDYKKEISLPSSKSLAFWLSQRLPLWFISHWADLICVTSQPEVKRFLKMGRKKKNIFVVKGGIDYDHLKKFQRRIGKVYQAVFVGRFHSQKGVIEMIDIWQKVVGKKPKAKLALIGLGPMEQQMRQKVKKYGLEKNIDFLGVMLGNDRNRVLQRSEIILHPAVYDSGGMAAAYGLACGLPGVSFDLPAFKTYYPNGFLKVRTGDFSGFAKEIIRLLEDKELYKKISKLAIKEASTWAWPKRIEKFWQTVK